MGTNPVIRLGVLTSSRADFGIYLPLLQLLKSENSFSFEIIAFGTHLSIPHGYTIQEIEDSGFEVKHRIESLLISDSPVGISSSFAITNLKFAEFWNTYSSEYDFILCLGDRFEMAAAVLAGVPLGVKFIHFYGGETTLGAIDNIYRHTITLSSVLHFVSAEPFKNRIKDLNGNGSNCFVVGSLSLDSLQQIKLLTKDEFYDKWGINLNLPTILVTVHPETIGYEKNIEYAKELADALMILSITNQIVITLPNADTNGTVFRKVFNDLQNWFPDKFYLIENFGKLSYFSCMKFSDYLIGNSSSGIVEAASFKKFVLNIGNRQNGRLSGENVIHVPFKSSEILSASRLISGRNYEGVNIYDRPSPALAIINILKQKCAEL